MKSRDVLAEQVGESKDQIRRYIRLTHLIPEILELVDNSVLKDQETLQIAMRPAVELSYLRKEEQADLFAIMDEMDCTPSHAQAIKMRQMLSLIHISGSNSIPGLAESIDANEYFTKFRTGCQ